MIYLQGLLFILIFSVIILIIGKAIISYFKWEHSLTGKLSWGFMTILAVFQLVAYPLYRMNANFTALFILFNIVLLVLFIFSLLYIFKAHVKSDKDCKLFLCFRQFPFLTIVTAGMIIFCLFMGLGFYYSSSDEGYNLTRAMETIEQNSLGVDDALAWKGASAGPIKSYENASTYYFFIAFLSKISHIHPTILYKTFFLFVLIILHLSAISFAYDSLIETEKNDEHFQKKSLFFIFYILFQMLAVKPSSAGTWMTGYLYEGKAVMIATVFPLLLGAGARLIRNAENANIKEWLSIPILLLAGIELSAVGLYLSVILYFCFGVAFLLCTKFKYFSKIWKYVLISLLPVAIFGVLSLTTANTKYLEWGGLVEYNSTTTENLSHMAAIFEIWKGHFLEGIDFFQFLLFISGAIYIGIKGSKIQKILLSVAPIVLLLTFLNPLLSDYVAAYITTAMVYWRLWWLLPIYICPALALSDLFYRLSKGNTQNALLTAFVTLGVISGFEIFRTSILNPDETIIPYITNVGRLFNVRPELRFNIYNLNPGPFETAKAIINDWDKDKRPRVFMCFNRPFELRQYSTDIELVAEVRNYDTMTDLIPGTDISMAEFAKTYNQIEDGYFLSDILNKLDINYICFSNQPAIKNPEDYGLIHISDAGGISLWRFK